MKQYNFNQFAAEGNEFINKLATKLGDSNNKARANRILKSVLHELRNRITPEESIQLISQLPFFLKAVYVDGWKVSGRQKRIKTLDEFLQAILERNRKLSVNDFEHIYEVKEATSVVLAMIGEYVSRGELKDIKEVLPREIGDFIFKGTTHHVG
jgi:uncharacterized protein (DUF2267 family)